MLAAFRGLGHVLAITRSLVTFSPTSDASTDAPSNRRTHSDSPAPDPMQEDTPPEKAETEAKLDSQETGAAETATREVHWSGKVGEQLRRDEQCLFETVGYAKAAFLSQPVSQPRSAVNLSCSPVSDMYSLPLQSHD